MTTLQRSLLLSISATLLLLLPAGLSCQSPTGGPRAGIDVLHYGFRLEFPARGVPETVYFATTITAHRTAAVATMSFDLVASMRVDSVLVNSRRAAFTRMGDSLGVALPDGLNDTIRVAVHYRGLPTDGLIIRRDSAGGWTAFGDNFPNRARQWLAVVDHPADKALVDWDVVAPSSHRVIANGALLEESPLIERVDTPMTPSRTRTRWRTARPIYTAVMVIGVAPFAVVQLPDTVCVTGELPGCVQQTVWTSPAQRAFVPGHFARANDIVALFSRLVGPFPYEKLAHVSSSTRYGGMENAAAIFYASELFTADGPRESLIAHETAHQWFGDAVTEREWPHVWLSEGFATYFAALWSEHAHGDIAFRRDREAMRDRVLKAPITFEKAVVDESLSDVRRVLNSNVYQKAGFVLHMLRREIGDTAFFSGIRDYYHAHRHGNALTSDFQAAVERSAGRSLDWFFAQWLTRPGIPELRPSWRWDAAGKRVVVTVQQGTRVAPYQIPVDVRITDATGAVFRDRIMLDAAPTSTVTLPRPLSAAPTRVEFDPDAELLARITLPDGR